MYRLSHCALLLSALVLLSCEAKHAPLQPAAGSLTPSKEIYPVLQLFLAADTINRDHKFHVAFLRQGTFAGDLSIYLMDLYHSNGDVNAWPLTTWQVDQKTIFVFTGLEAVASGGDTTQRHLIRETDAANMDRIWTPAFRCWRIDVQDQKVTHIDKQVPFSSAAYPFLRSPPPPPDFKLP
jgi:hypothetical protein